MSPENDSISQAVIESLHDETGIAGVPVKVVEQRVLQRFLEEGEEVSIQQIRAAIRELLDNWVIDKTVDELDYKVKNELGLPQDEAFTWHLKLLTEDQSDYLRALRPEAKALIKLLREQNDTNWLGVMPKREAVEKLAQQGFKGDLEYIHAEDMIEDFMTSWDGNSSVWCYGLVREHHKTDEYKQWHEEMMRKSSEKEAMRYRFTEECETTDPIHGRLDELAEKRGEDLERLELRKDEMSREEYLQRKRAIEERDAEEEEKWNRVIELVPTLPFDVLIDLRNLLWEGVPPPDDVLTFLDMKLSDKEDS
ncbi:MAG: hypothetical protein ACP6KW_08665 [Candidatus Thorarchaeota archaeon]